MSLLQTLQQQTLPAKYTQLTENEMKRRVLEIKKKLGSKLFLLGHHYQKDEVYEFADVVGDSLQLAQIAAENREAEHIVFCGVHFMAETADILTAENQKVILPDMRAGCSMADMATIQQTEKAWPVLQDLFGDTIIPLTYVNSTAAIKSFVGEHDGATVTSSNAKNMVEWAFSKKERILFLPDQHLGRNTAYDLGVGLDEMAIWNPIEEMLEYEGDINNIKVILWKGHCSVHENFTVKNIDYLREKQPEMNIIVHPECSYEVVQKSDYAGSTKYIIDTIEKAPSGSKWAIGTEMNLVKRIINSHPDKEIVSLNPYMCPCLTMNRIDLPHLLWALESIEEGIEVNQIKVDKHTAQGAIKALTNMLERA
ncbi:quinolinate synthase NadA [Priestia aryabhattai]|uniref:Quinolinate synthase n=1 Tax=Priestia aryabhattai TaxID=412384 RepID=A0AAX6NAM5_PRIAR|nr:MULTISPECIES: quinolinate synthase NadA [Priestia]MDU9692951.1 quinolinate synthase NadA [Priestia aryabhattai]QDZ78452.1 quinolinate synthase NadA [Priestia megaterium]TPF15233.1 quinolinate synthetase [Priestia megaterium]TPF20573.1 quinolinate synthetase [Priestia megaterium]SUV12783.1 quinolinate synthetase complex subunit A [Priestia megaterium]